MTACVAQDPKGPTAKPLCFVKVSFKATLFAVVVSVGCASLQGALKFWCLPATDTCDWTNHLFIQLAQSINLLSLFHHGFDCQNMFVLCFLLLLYEDNSVFAHYFGCKFYIPFNRNKILANQSRLFRSQMNDYCYYFIIGAWFDWQICLCVLLRRYTGVVNLSANIPMPIESYSSRIKLANSAQ